MKPEFPIWTSASDTSYASPTLDTTILPLEQVRGRSHDSDSSFVPFDEPRLLPRNQFLRHCPNHPPSTPDFTAAVGVLPARHRQRQYPPQHLAKQTPAHMSLGQQQPNYFRGDISNEL
jgi:hypothetical protein